MFGDNEISADKKKGREAPFDVLVSWPLLAAAHQAQGCFHHVVARIFREADLRAIGYPHEGAAGGAELVDAVRLGLPGVLALAGGGLHCIRCHSRGGQPCLLLGGAPGSDRLLGGLATLGRRTIRADTDHAKERFGRERRFQAKVLCHLLARFSDVAEQRLTDLESVVGADALEWSLLDVAVEFGNPSELLDRPFPGYHICAPWLVWEIGPYSIKPEKSTQSKGSLPR